MGWVVRLSMFKWEFKAHRVGYKSLHLVKNFKLQGHKSSVRLKMKKSFFGMQLDLNVRITHIPVSVMVMSIYMV